jgi:shikimate dehydrogenase
LLRVGLIGSGILQSRSPALHMDEAAALGLKVRYELFDLDLQPSGSSALGTLLGLAQRQGFAGLNITYPCKQQVIGLLDELSEEAAALQAVNTVVFSNGRRIGHNTDWWGFAESFRRELSGVARSRVVQLGAGGAGSAVAFAAAKQGIRQLSLVDTDQARALALAARLAVIAPDMTVETTTDVEAVLARADGLIHATPIGMQKSPGMAVSERMLRPNLWVAEVVYVPLVTELLAVARRRGCRTLDGGGMAVFQAVAAFRLFTGVEPDAERMMRSFLAKVSSGQAAALLSD